MRLFRSHAVAAAAEPAAIQELTADEITEVGGGCWPIIVIAVACAVLLSHD